jgi:hypothetical protein
VLIPILGYLLVKQVAKSLNNKCLASPLLPIKVNKKRGNIIPIELNSIIINKESNK